MKKPPTTAKQLADLMPEITIRGDCYDGRGDDDETPKDRDDAVYECWSMWLEHDCDKAWSTFIRAVRKEQG